MRTYVVHKDYKDIENFLLTIPSLFEKGEGKAVYITGSTILYPAHKDAVQMAFKLLSATSGASTVVTTIEDGFFKFNAPVAGTYAYQQTNTDGVVMCYGRFTVEQNLATAPANYDPRSYAEKALEAIDAKIAGRVLTLEQSQITVGDRSITYINSIKELERWRDYFQAIVNKEQGIAPYKSEVVFLKRV